MAFSNSRAFICYLNNCKNIFKSWNNVSNNTTAIASCQAFNKRLYVTEEALAEEVEICNIGLPKRQISKAMKTYLQRSVEHNEFMQKAKVEYEIGKRHLANMMGENPDNFSQDDINNAIEYLFPSGVHDPRARPIMKPPEEVFPVRKAAEFNEYGRPFNSMFYTCRPNYYQTLHSIVGEMNKLDEKEDKLYKLGSTPDENVKINLSASTWLSMAELEKILVENLTDQLYEYFINTMERLAAHPLAYEAETFIMKYRKVLQGFLDTVEVLPMEHDSNGRPYVTVKDCMRKSSRGVVILRGNGSGKITINGQDIAYFKDFHHREQNFMGIPDGIPNIFYFLFTIWSIRFGYFDIKFESNHFRDNFLSRGLNFCEVFYI